MKSIEVVAAIIQDGNRIFATQRGYGDFKDWWEFPGGKMEEGETPEEALVREIREELSADIQVGKLLHTVEWDYPKFHLTMHCFMCALVHDALHLNEHEAAKWLDVSTLHSVKWLPADEILLPMIEKELNFFQQFKNPPKFNVGNTIYWYCDDDQRVHHAKVLSIVYFLAGEYVEEISYEVLDECNGPAVRRYIDQYDATDKDLSA